MKERYSQEKRQQKRWKLSKLTSGGTNLKIILCEGRNDAWFFDEIMKEHLGDSIHAIPDGVIRKLQRVLGRSGYNFLKKQYDLIIFGDGGRRTMIEKVMRRVVAATLGVGDDIYILLILDDDGVGYGELKNNISDKLKSISKDRLFSNQPHILKETGGSFILNHPRGRGIVEIQLSTVPESLELQVARKYIEVKCQWHYFKQRPHLPIIRYELLLVV